VTEAEPGGSLREAQLRGLTGAPEGGPPSSELTLAHLDSLPTPAPQALRLLQLTIDDRSSVADLVPLIQKDQSLTAKVLSVANSAALAAREPISTLDRAVVRLGFTAVRSIALAVKMVECFGPAAHGRGRDGFDRLAFWKHALAVACAARKLAAAAKALNVHPDEAFVAGLLHDLGKVALDSVFPKTYERVVVQVNQARGDIADFERTLLGIDHTVAGRHVAERWGLPRHLQEVIWLHHLSPDGLPSSVASPQLIALVQLADTLAREQRIGYSGNHAFYESAAELAEQIGLSADAANAVARELVSEVAAQIALLGIEREAPQALFLESLTQANQELARLNTDLVASNRRLAAAARYFTALTDLDRRLNAWSDLAAVVAAIAEIATAGLQRPRMLVFALRDTGETLDAAWTDRESGRCEARTEALPADLRAWLADPGESRDLPIMRAAPAVRALFATLTGERGEGDCWLLPFVRDAQIAGGLVYLSTADEAGRLADETAELRPFLASLGLAIGRANAQAAARRLSDELAEANRRLQQMRAELLRSRTLAMIAEMAAGAGHELNGPLSVISGRAQMLKESVADPDAQRALDLIHTKAHECSRIVSELMDFARPQPPRLQPVDLLELLGEIREQWLAQSGLAASRFVLLAPPSSPEAPRRASSGVLLLVDREQVRTVLVELCRNASDAIAGSAGTITIQWQIAAPPAVPSSTGLLARERPASRSPHGWVEVVVRDNGCGMSNNVLQRAFDPFFSYRQAGRRRGLGLARAHRIVDAHGGRIWLESQPGQGTVAHVVLPLAEPPVR
jgi:putative nucleotidyltransferase with HDIG domain